MEISSIIIQYLCSSEMEFTQNGLRHIKSLPYLSIVQSVEGSYGIQIDRSPVMTTGDLGFFVAPRDKMQYITHYVNPTTGRMRAQWIFLDVIINHKFQLEELYDFPVVYPAEYNSAFYTLIRSIIEASSPCKKMSQTYLLLDLLLEKAVPKPASENMITELRKYISEHFKDKLTPELLAKQFNISLPTLYRKFHAGFDASPVEYINSVRLQNASLLLEYTNQTVKEISKSVGFDNEFYFSRLFKQKYKLSPQNYRVQTKRRSPF